MWRSSLKIAELASQCFLATGLYRCPPPAILSDLTVQMVKLQRNLLGRSNQATVEMLHTLVHHADLITSAHMYILCSALSQKEVKRFTFDCPSKTLRISERIAQQPCESVKLSASSFNHSFTTFTRWMYSGRLRVGCRVVPVVPVVPVG